MACVWCTSIKRFSPNGCAMMSWMHGDRMYGGPGEKLINGWNLCNTYQNRYHYAFHIGFSRVYHCSCPRSSCVNRIHGPVPHASLLIWQSKPKTPRIYSRISNIYHQLYESGKYWEKCHHLGWAGGEAIFVLFALYVHPTPPVAQPLVIFRVR